MNNKISNLDQICYIRKYTINDTKNEGLKVIELYNGILRVLLNESKALDIMQLFYKGINMSFISKNGFSTKNNEFIKRFEGGMLYTVGLDSAGARDGFELHGSFHNLKPTITKSLIGDKGIEIEAFIEDTELFGKNLVLKRKYFLGFDSNELILEDTLINKGKENTNYCILYHNNIGYPMLDDGDKLLINTNNIEPRTTFAKEKIDECFDITSPIDITDETCYYLDIKDGKASVVNNKLNLKFTILYSNDTLNNFVLWKSMKSQDYALGFEPSTAKLDDKFKYSIIKPNQEIDFKLIYKIEN